MPILSFHNQEFLKISSEWFAALMLANQKYFLYGILKCNFISKVGHDILDNMRFVQMTCVQTTDYNHRV